MGPYQRLRREHAAYSSESLTLMKNYTYVGLFSLTKEDISELSQRLRVPESLLVFNAQRLRSICYTLLAIYEAFRYLVFHDDNHAFQNQNFNTQQMSFALEFFLQIDGKSIIVSIYRCYLNIQYLS